uniref:Par3_HAL_N_term domain-containing protein n=1 Tax=Ascaris lumbricoides TaxID=6252 RepID=A0A0M3ILW4_ASCLU
MAAAFCQQNANYVTPSNFIVRVHHLECIRDGGILDPDDLLFDVFDEERDQVLAIYDEQDDTPSHSQQKMKSRFAIRGISSPPSSPSASISTLLENHTMNISSNADGDIVEITSLSEPPTEGLRVISDAAHALQQLPSSSSSLSRSDYGSGSGSVARYEQKRPSTGRVYPPALKTADRSPKVKHKVTLSPGPGGN